MMNSRRTLVLVTFAAILLLAGGCANPQPLPLAPTAIPTLLPATLPPPDTPTPQPDLQNISFPQKPPSAAAGQVLYNKHCANCHGRDGNGVVPNARNFGDVDYVRGETPLRFYQIITDGRDKMPGWRDELSDEERWDLTFYIWHFSTGPEMLRQGKEVYDRRCERCHGPTGAGEVPDVADFTDTAWVAQHAPRDFFQVVTEGQGSMPAWQRRLTPGERWAAIEYMRTFAYQALPEDLAGVLTAASEFPAGTVRAVDLIGAWVEAGAPESDPFTYTGIDGQEYKATFEEDVFPLFTEPDVWFPGADACTSCHTADLETSDHELDMTTYEGIMAGADRLSKAPGEPIIVPGDWEHSKLRGRLRNNRMPTGITDRVPRNGPVITTKSGGEIRAVELIGAWVDAGAKEAEAFTFEGTDGKSYQGTFGEDILPLFTEPDVWYAGADECTKCHTPDLETSDHELDLTTYEGIMAGADRLSEPPGEPIIVPGDWERSKLRGRLRNNRMPTGITDKVPRNGPMLYGK